MDDAGLCVLEDFGTNSSRCGYCKSSDTSSISHGMWAHALSAAAYQDLLDRGWRRSGRYIYKPDVQTCCPQYTIRLDTRLFTPSKSQERIMRRAERPQPDADPAVAAHPSCTQKPVHVREPAGDQAAHAASPVHLLQQLPQPQQIGHLDSKQAMVLASAIDAAVASCQAAAALPQAQYVASSAMPPTPKQRRRLPHDVRLTSPSAMAVAGTARKAQPAQQRSLTAASVANMLAARLNDRMLPVGWTVSADAGHLNCTVSPVQPRLLANGSCSDLQPGLAVQRAAPAASSNPAAAAEPEAQALTCARVSAAAEAAAFANTQVFATTQSQAAAGVAAEQMIPGSVAQPMTAAAIAGCQADAPASQPAAAARKLPRVHIGKRRSFDSMNDIEGMSPPSSRQRSEAWQGVEGASPMSISGVSPALGGQHLLRTGSLAAVTSGYQEAALVRSGSDRHLQRGASPGTSHAADLPAARAFVLQPTSPTANGSQPAEHDHGSVATAIVPAVQQLNERLPANTAVCASQLDRMASSDQAHDVIADTVLPAAQAAGGDSCAAGIRRLEVRMVPATKELVDTEFELYKHYQVSQHGEQADEVSTRQFVRFLVDSPLPAPATGQLPANGATHLQPASSHGGVTSADEAADRAVYGTFHMQYWLGLALVAVSVVDVLPKCLSSVYMFWDKRYAHLSLGKYSVLREVDFVRRASCQQPQLQYLYLGYYIPNNEKMMYKAEFQPSDLLCPKTYCWVPHQRVRMAVLASSAYISLSAVPSALVGLGSAHGIGDSGQPDTSALQVDSGAVQQTLVLRTGMSTGRQLARLGHLLQLCPVPDVDAQRLLRQVEAVHAAVGAAVARQLVLVLPGF